MAKPSATPPQHRWDVTPAEARQIQEQVRSRVSRKSGRELHNVKYVAGVDCALRNNHAIAAVPVLRFDTLELVDLAVIEKPLTFPYVPGLLTFRECPSILAAMEQLKIKPDLVMVDGQGIAPPRRIGIAAHLGVLLDKPTIGVAKSRLIGTHDEPYHKAGCYTDLWDKDDLIGAVLRTRDNVNPLYISIGQQDRLADGDRPGPGVLPRLPPARADAARTPSCGKYRYAGFAGGNKSATLKLSPGSIAMSVDSRLESTRTSA
jgi:deoxyribonuclease V